MGDGPIPDRVEVELTPTTRRTERARPERHGRPIDSHVEPSPARAVRRGPDVRPSTALLVAATGVAALVTGVVIGRTSRSEPDATDAAVIATTPTTASPSTTGPAATGPAATDPGLVPLPPPSGPATTSPATTTSTSVAVGDARRSTIAVAPIVAAEAMEIVGLTSDGTVLILDAATGRLAQTAVAGSQFGPPDVVAGAGWVLLPSADPQRASVVLFDDGTTARVDTGFNWPLLTIDGTDRLWRTENEVGAEALTLTEVSVIDGSTGRTLELNGFPQLVDPATGGVVVEAPGGSYVVDTDGARRVTSGRLVGLGPTVALVEDCDDAMECGYFVVDRGSGERRALTLDRVSGGRATVLSSGWWTFRRPMAPTERHLLVASWDQFGPGSPSNGVLDLETGAYEVITDRLDTPQMEWAPSGEIVLWLDRGRLAAYDLASGESTPVADELGQFIAFTVRASATGDDG